MTRRGRPPGTVKAFRSDPDRFAIAFFDALTMAGMSENKARRLTAGVFFGCPVPAPVIPASAKARRLVGAGWYMASFQTPIPVANKASTVLKKAQRATSDGDLQWRAAIAGAIWLALFEQGMPFAMLRGAIRLLCDTASEPDFADTLLATMVARDGAPSDLFSRIFPLRHGVDGTGPDALTEAARDPRRT